MDEDTVEPSTSKVVAAENKEKSMCINQSKLFV